MLSSERLPQMQALLQNLSARLEPYLYLRKAGLHSALWLSTLGQELKKLEGDISLLHSQGESKETKTLSAEVTFNQLHCFCSFLIVSIQVIENFSLRSSITEMLCTSILIDLIVMFVNFHLLPFYFCVSAVFLYVRQVNYG